MKKAGATFEKPKNKTQKQRGKEMKIKRPLHRFAVTVSFILCGHALGLAFLSAFRLLQYVTLRGMSAPTGASAVPAFVRGLWLDNVLACAVLALPATVLLIAACFGFCPRALRKAFVWWMAVFYTVMLALSAANIPYFHYFFKTINSGIFAWFGYAGTTAGMVTGELSYIIYIAAFIIAAALFAWLLVLLRRKADRLIAQAAPCSRSRAAVAAKGIATTLLAGLIVLGIRGHAQTDMAPVKVSQAYYCADPFLNQLAIPPAFNVVTSLLDDMKRDNAPLNLMPDSEAVAETRSRLGIIGRTDSAFVLRRKVAADSKTAARRNVVIILMESMSADLMQTFGQKHRLTPVLDSLFAHSLAFRNCYSAGIHTNNGLTATLYSFPALMRRNVMKGTVTPRRGGIPTVLAGYGYRTMFFMPHESQYDNMNAYFRTNGYGEIYSQEDYPAEEAVNTFGVSDHFLFGYALRTINAKAGNGQPFMATILTVSNHPPYVIPDFFQPKSADKEQQIVEYADWAVGDFIAKARREPWYKNTVFVLLGDHGKLTGNAADTELPQSLNHIPLIMFGAGVPTAQVDGMASQVDVMPTLLGLLGMSYDYDGFGYDLLRQGRNMVQYTSDDQIVARDSTHCLIYNHSTGRTDTYAAEPGGRLRKTKATDGFEQLRRFALSTVQTADFVYRREH